MFMTKVWGFGSPSGPLQFGTDGWRKNALRKLVTGDLVALVGTQDEPTPPEMRGRVLAVMQPSHTPVMTLDYDVPTRPSDRNEDGAYKWPYALINTAAWTVPSRPLLAEVSSRQFEMDAVRGIVPLTSDEEAKVRSFVWTPSALRSMTAAAQERMDRQHGIARQYSPPPATTRRVGVMHLRGARAYTYAFALRGASQSSFKIGWAFDYTLRMKQFNRMALPEIGGITYGPALHFLWSTARQAYKMEQLILKRFASKRHPQNHEVIVGVREVELQSSWSNALLDLR